MAKSQPKSSRHDESAALQAEIAELRAGWQRTQADFANAARRWEDERRELSARCTAETLLEIVPALDNFDRAFAHLPNEQAEWATGFQHIKKQLDDILVAHGVDRLKTVGEIFDPTLHEAIGEEASDQTEGTILREVEAGYRHCGRVVRPAKVIVSKGEAHHE